jgi:cold shock CspA family protein
LETHFFTLNKTIKHNLLLSRKGTVNFYDLYKGYGSIRDNLTRHNYIVYGRHLAGPIIASDYVSFEIEETAKGLVARGVKLIRA